MKQIIRTFQKEVFLKTTAQYAQNPSNGTLVLRRWRVEVDGESVGKWRAANRGKNGGWSSRINVRGFLGGKS